jgi:ABC-type glutathione transport system ATPase component
MPSQNLKKPSTISKNPIIQVDNLNVYYNIPSANIFKKSTFHAVKDVSFKIFENTTIGLVGESGLESQLLEKQLQI